MVQSENEFEHLLYKICIDHNFACRGKAFFRVIGDGVLQTIKIQREKTFGGYELFFGLQSMYSNLPKRHFTANGCIPKYYIFSITGKKGALSLEYDHDILLPTIDSAEKQVDFLNNYVISWMDNITTQNELINAIIYLEKKFLVQLFGIILKKLHHILHKTSLNTLTGL